jgi:hypothetical protein
MISLTRSFAATPYRPYQHETSSSLVRKYMVYKFFTPEGVIKHSESIIQSLYTFLGKTLTDSLVMGTWGKVFVGGKDEHEMEQEISLLNKSGVFPIIECPMDMIEGSNSSDV